MLKLDDTHLVRRAQLVSKMLANADERTCAGVAVGALTGDDFMKMMKALPEEDQAVWFKMIRAAAEAEVGGGAAPPPLPT